jgi:TRAP transporter 4TM/12TM fusion protein
MERDKNTWNRILTLIAVALGMFQLYTAMFGVLTAMWQRSVHLAFGFLLVFLSSASKSKNKSMAVGGIILSLLGVLTTFYIFADFDGIMDRFGNPSTLDLLFGAIAILLVLEMTRRATGWVLPMIGLIFILYAYLGPYMPGVFKHRGYDLERIIHQLYLTTEGIFGIPLGVSTDFVYLFILFGGFLTLTGTGQFYIDLANAAVGTARGGPAKVAVVSSALFGTISGSAVANVASTGAFTIPLMKKTGYHPNFAGAVEASASTGGQLMPPVMGAAAFVMAEFLRIPYVEVAKSAVIPALIYFGAIFSSVHLEALRTGLKGLDPTQVDRFWRLIRKKGYLLLPLLLLIFLMVVVRWDIMKVAVFSVMACLAIAIVDRSSRFNWDKFLESFSSISRSVIVVMSSCALAGIIVGIVNLTGVGLRLSSMMIALVGQNVILILIVMMVVSILLGMGLPTTPAYIILAVLAVPSVVELGIPPLAAHFFIFYFGMLSMVSPPVALAVSTAIGISGGDFWKTGINSVKLTLSAFILPYFFIFDLALFMQGSLFKILFVSTTAMIGAYFLSTATIGWMFGKVAIWGRIILLVSSISLIHPSYTWSLLGLVGVGIMALYQYLRLPVEERVRILGRIKNPIAGGKEVVELEGKRARD